MLIIFLDAIASPCNWCCGPVTDNFRFAINISHWWQYYSTVSPVSHISPVSHVRHFSHVSHVRQSAMSAMSAMSVQLVQSGQSSLSSQSSQSCLPCQPCSPVSQVSPAILALQLFGIKLIPGRPKDLVNKKILCFVKGKCSFAFSFPNKSLNLGDS